MSSVKTYSGTCLCGAVRYEVDTPIKFVAHDHCSICQKANGAAFVTWCGVRSEQFRLIKGPDNLSTYKSTPEAERQFCSNCGSPLFFRSSRWDGEVHFTRATIESEMKEQPQAHVFFGSKASWLHVKDCLPRYGGETGLEPLSEGEENFTRYVVLLAKVKGFETSDVLIREHIEFLRDLDKKGQLELCGPFTDYEGGMIIFKVKTLDEAKRVAASDPFVKKGSRTFEIRTWKLSCEENNHLGVGN